MNKFTTLMILIIGILMISIFNFNRVKETFELNDKGLSINYKNINKENKYIKSELKIPQITIKDKDIQNALNKKFESEVTNFYKSSLNEAEAFFDDFPEMENKFIISSEFEVKKSNDKVLSMLIKYYKYSGGAHGNYEYIPYNVDLSSGKILILKDIFNKNSNYKEIIGKEIQNQIKNINEEQNLSEDSTQIYSFTNIKENQKFYIQDEKIIVFFDLYEIAPYAMGIPEFTINKNQIENLLNNKYKNSIF